MSDPRPTARSIAHAAFRKSAERGSPLGPMCWTDGWERSAAPCIYVCDDVTAAIESDRAASDAREDRLREALLSAASLAEAGAEVAHEESCSRSFDDCDDEDCDCADIKERIAGWRALAAIPKHGECWAHRRDAFLAETAPTASPEPDRASPEVTVKEDEKP